MAADTPNFTEQQVKSWRAGRLSARPGKPTSGGLPAGKVMVVAGEGTTSESFLFVPAPLPAAKMPLVVMLHGATQSAQSGLKLVQKEAAARGIAVLAPKSQDYSWDIITGGFGPDVSLIDQLLEKLFDTLPIDASRVAVAGFSDGGSMALSLGLANGDLFKHIFAFSPGFIVPSEARGRPEVYISQGTKDTVLPINRTGRPIERDLKAAGYDVDFYEFAGGHAVPAESVAKAFGKL